MLACMPPIRPARRHCCGCAQMYTIYKLYKKLARGTHIYVQLLVRPAFNQTSIHTHIHRYNVINVSEILNAHK